jgi:hypothetical protein
MRAARELLAEIAQRLEPRGRCFECDGGVVCLPDGSIVPGRECSGLATDAAPREPAQPALANVEWLQPDPEAMAEASHLADLFAGVPYSIGRERLTQYAAQREERPK